MQHVNSAKDVAKARDSKERKSRAGAPNYSQEDVVALLRFVEDVEPLGSGNWALVALKFAQWAVENERPHREQISLRNKFDKLANTKVSPADPLCPVNVRKAKNIARAIHNKYATMHLDDEEVEERDLTRVKAKQEDHDQVAKHSRSNSDAEDTDVVTPRLKKRKRGAHPPTPGLNTEELLLTYVGQMTKHIGSIAKSLISEPSSPTSKSLSSLTKEEVHEIVKREVRENMMVTNNILSKMNLMLENISAKMNAPKSD